METTKSSSRRAPAARPCSKRPVPGEMLRRRSRLYRRMYDESPIGIVLYDHEGCLVAANKSCRAMVGMPGHFDVGRWFANLFVDPTIPDWAKRDLRNGQVVRYRTEIDYDALREHRVYHGNRSGICCVDVVMTPLNQRKAGGLIGYMTQVQDVTDLNKARRQVDDYQAQLRSLSSELSLAEEKERRHLATALHDNVGQTLALVRFRLGDLGSKVSGTGPRALVAEIRGLVDQAADQTRALTFELSPPVLYELGLEPALEWLAEQYHARYGMVIRFQRARSPSRISDEMRGLLFSSVRELLMNAIKHSRARAVRISVAADGGNLSVTVKDNGAGFDPGSLESHAGGFGLFNIRERIAGAGGRMTVDAKRGRGTTVTLTVPLPPPAGKTEE